MEKTKTFLKTRNGLIVSGLILLVIGFMSGMEYKAYQVRTALRDAFSGFGNIQNGGSVKKNIPVSNDLDKKVSMSIESKGFYSASFQDQNTFKLKFTNNTGKDIEGVQGVLSFSDLFGNTIKNVNVSYDEGIKTGESKIYSAGIDYNQFMDSDIKLKSTDLGKLKYEWHVNTIIYTDGTKETE